MEILSPDLLEFLEVQRRLDEANNFASRKPLEATRDRLRTGIKNPIEQTIANAQYGRKRAGLGFGDVITKGYH